MEYVQVRPSNPHRQLRCLVMMNGGDAKGAKNENEGIQELAKKIRQTAGTIHHHSRSDCSYLSEFRSFPCGRDHEALRRVSRLLVGGLGVADSFHLCYSSS